MFSRTNHCTLQIRQSEISPKYMTPKVSCEQLTKKIKINIMNFCHINIKSICICNTIKIYPQTDQLLISSMTNQKKYKSWSDPTL